MSSFYVMRIRLELTLNPYDMVVYLFTNLGKINGQKHVFGWGEPCIWKERGLYFYLLNRCAWVGQRSCFGKRKLPGWEERLIGKGASTKCVIKH